MKIYLSDIDRDRFGIQVAQIRDPSLENIPAVLEFCAQNDVKLAILRCLSEDITLAQALEKANFFLTDTLMMYSRRIDNNFMLHYPENIIIDGNTQADAEAIKELVKATFKDYPSHYYNDPFLDRKQVAEIYPDWAYRACFDKQIATCVFQAFYAKTLAGFATIKQHSIDTAEAILFGVHPKFAGKNIYKCLVDYFLNWCRENNIENLKYSTQLVNKTAQKVITSKGFTLSDSYYTFHRWF